MTETNAVDFYERIVEGQDKKNEITLEHSSNAELSGVEMNPVSKRVLASVVERLPDEMFQAVEESDNPDEAEAELEEQGASTDAVTEETVGAFEDLCKESLSHEELTDVQMRHIIDELDFEILFSLGAEIIEMSFDNSGDIKDFHEQD